jgi:phytoene dehydrogenase-like protein
VLVKKYRDNGGELRLKCGVKSIQVDNGRAMSILLDNHEMLTADRIISSAGYVETMRLLSDHDPARVNHDVGQLSFVEFIMILDKEPSKMGYDTTITFFNNSDRFHYRKPDDLVDISSGVICCPNNFHFENPLPEAMLRVTNMANFDHWNKLGQEEYKIQKAAWLETTLKEVVKFVPDFRESIVYTDIFTPKTMGLQIRLRQGARIWKTCLFAAQTRGSWESSEQCSAVSPWQIFMYCRRDKKGEGN